MNTDFTNVKVGDAVIIGNSWGEHIARVTKVNKSTFVVENKTFRKDNGWQYGGDIWYRWCACIPTQEDLDRIKAKEEKEKLIYNILNKATSVKLIDYDIETLQRICELLNKEKKK